MIKPPSLIRDATWIWPGDPALDAPPLDASEEVRDAWAHRIKVAQDTGGWDGLFKAGEKPTRFTVRYITGTRWRALRDAIAEGKIGTAIADTLVVRLALKGLSNLTGDDGETELTFEEVTGFGKIASESVIDMLDAYDVAIVRDLAVFIIERQAGPRPK